MGIKTNKTNDILSLRNKMKDEKKEVVFSELNSLLSSGLDFSRAFQLLIEEEPDKKTETILKALYGNVVKGKMLCVAIKDSDKFSALDSGVIRIGEETGKLTESLAFLSSYYSKKGEQRRIIGTALRYPIIILSIALIVVVFMLAMVVPMFEEVYTRMGGELPGITKWIISMSKSFPVYGAVISAVLFAGALFFYKNKDKKSVRAFTSSLGMKIPFLKDIIKKNNQAHFCKLLGLLTGSGVPILHGINMLGAIITFYPYQNSFGVMAKGLTRGELLSGNLEKYHDLYDKKLVTLVKIGEETNRLPMMFEKQGKELTSDLEFRLQKLGSIIEPALVMIVGLLVAVILISMYMPMFKLGGIMN